MYDDGKPNLLMCFYGETEDVRRYYVTVYLLYLQEQSSQHWCTEKQSWFKLISSWACRAAAEMTLCWKTVSAMHLQETSSTLPKGIVNITEWWAYSSDKVVFFCLYSVFNQGQLTVEKASYQMDPILQLNDICCLDK